MAMWCCPHCRAPQAEASRCWVCGRGTTTCSTCRHYRQAVAGRLAYCALDARRALLTGDEMRACWMAPPPEPVLLLDEGLSVVAAS